MKKIWFLMSFLACSLLLTWCDSYNNLTTYDEQTVWCEKWILSHWVEKADFERKWSEKIWDIVVITWIQYGYNWLANQEVSCEFNENGKLLWIKSSNLRNYETNNSWNVINMWENIVPWWYLYRNLDLDNEEDKLEYEALQNDRNMILKYQTDTSAAVNKFIDVIHDDLLDYCQEYWTGYETMKWTMYERDVCMDNYIRDLYEKLRVNLILPQKDYSWDDPVLISYYNDLNWDHPFVRYFVDLYTEIVDWVWDYWPLPEYPNIWPIIQFENWDYWGDEEKWSELAEKYWTGFYTYWRWNVEIDWIEETLEVITSIESWIVINWQMLDRIQSEYWYKLPIYKDDIAHWTSPMDWPFVLHVKDKYDRDFIYQIFWDWAWSGEFLLMIWMLENWKRIPVWWCGNYWYVLFPRYPLLFGYNQQSWVCEKWKRFDPLTIFTHEENLNGWNIKWSVDNFTFFLKSLESTRVLSK